MPGTGQSPQERLAQAAPLTGTPGQLYVERRGMSLPVAETAGVRFDADFCGRPAVLVSLRDREGALVSLHGRYLHSVRGQNKMLTIGRSGYERRGEYALSSPERRALREHVKRQWRALNGRLDLRWLDFNARPIHVVEPDGRAVLEGATEARDEVTLPHPRARIVAPL